MAGPVSLAHMRAIIVEEEWEFGTKLADGLVAGGYRPVVFRFIDDAIAELRSIRPRVIFVGRRSSEPAAQANTTEAFLLIDALLARVSMNTIADTVDEDLTTVVVRHGARRFLFKTVKFSQVGPVLHQVLQSEFDKITV